MSEPSESSACRYPVPHHREPRPPERHLVLALQEVPARVYSIPKMSTTPSWPSTWQGEILPIVRERAADFLGIAETQGLLDQLEQLAPAVVRQVVPKPVSVTQLADVLRRLLDERVSIRDLRGILEALSLLASTEKDP